MCLAVPGNIISIDDDKSLMRSGKVNFAGIVKQINLTFVPEAVVGDYVLAHAGFAISIIDEAEAQQVFEYLKQMDEQIALQD